MDTLSKAKLAMDTVIRIKVVPGHHRLLQEAEERINRAFMVFRSIEQACSRFDVNSELMRACRETGRPVPISPRLFEPLKFALAMAEVTDGAFDPTVGLAQEELGFNRHYLTGETARSTADRLASFRDIVLNERDRTLFLRTPLVIDLGAVAKGFAIDLAASELKDFAGFMIDAGGDLYAGGLNERGELWQVGIRHPIYKHSCLQTLDISNQSICTSGGYERKSPLMKGVHHIIDPKSRRSPNEWISCSIIAPFAMMADAFSTAAFLMNAENGERLIEQAGISGIMMSSNFRIVNVGGI
ncbi:FAD:protein FMN transferase [Paenibacillus glycinis]|uniref:FAD:protein FMN transferase n=1 Tax=Paenibacillus glycinis TaxID=2697035 RepID=A0ABW9XQT8_9BACL|nr:FAD:protein FMN transferase [Paenibacillus glycinis]NBD25005.1 FAD:protein FMN transferase [Paenibacillus glycinis]